MKRILQTTLLAGLLVVGTSCEIIVSVDDTEDSPGEVRTFYAQSYSSAWYTVKAELLSEGTFCDVYVERGAGVTQKTAEIIAEEFDSEIFIKITKAFGEPYDVDKNGKIILLLLDIEDGYDPNVGGGYVAGYFDSTHMLAKFDEPYSNECDMIFVDVNPVEPGSMEFYTTIAHEFQHLINFSRTYMVNSTQQDLWINEGLSSAAEYVYTGEISEERVAYFNTDYYGTISLGNNFFVWYGYWENKIPNAVLDNYATVNLFFQWLRIHADNGIAIYKEILDSEKRDYRAVTTAAGKRIGEEYSDWARLLETWYLANFRHQDSGVYGYKNVIETTELAWERQDSSPYELEAGEGVISALGATPGDVGFFTPPSGSGENIQYIGFNQDETIVDRNPSFTNEYMLVFNANTDNTPYNFEKGYVATIDETSTDRSVTRNVQEQKTKKRTAFPKKFPIGFHPGYAGVHNTPEQRILKNKSGRVESFNLPLGKKGM